MIAGAPADVDGAPSCSSAGCGARASWRVNWRNPRIHGPERVKVWLACEEHRTRLADYLGTRGFPVRLTPLAEAVEEVGP